MVNNIASPSNFGYVKTMQGFRRKAKEIIELNTLIKTQNAMVLETPSPLINQIDNHIDLLCEIIFEIKATEQAVKELTCYVMAKQSFLKFDADRANEFFMAYARFEQISNHKPDFLKELHRKMYSLISRNNQEMVLYIAEILK